MGGLTMAVVAADGPYVGAEAYMQTCASQCAAQSCECGHAAALAVRHLRSPACLICEPVSKHTTANQTKSLYGNTDGSSAPQALLHATLAVIGDAHTLDGAGESWMRR